MSNNISIPIPIPGDIIFTERILYKHYGVYIGQGQVIHYTGPAGHETDPTQADIIQTSIEKFLRGDELYIERSPEDFKYKPLEPTKVVERAISKLGKGKGKYNLVDHNCEHFANWCKYDVAFSRQVDDAAVTIVHVAEPIFRFLYWISQDKVIKSMNTVSLEDALLFFKKKERLKLLRENSDLLAMVIKEQNDFKYYIICTIFDKNTNETNEENTIVWQTSHLEDDLLNAFGKRNMIILQ